MTIFLALILAVLSICGPSTSLHEIHKQMTKKELRSIFYVDSVDAVPKYELIQLIHNGAKGYSDSLNRQKRSTLETQINTLFDNKATNNVPAKERRHVKKDLSKNPYFSKIKQGSSNEKRANSINSNSDKASFIDVSQIKEHNVSFSAFGEVLNLTLRPTKGLFKKGPQSLRMWTVRNEPNATHGLEMEEVLDEESSDQIGEVFQDERNMAAILMRRHLETGDLIMEGNIGYEMVVKPLPHKHSPSRDSAYHVIFKKQVSALDQLTDFAYMEPDDLETNRYHKNSQARRKRSTEGPFMIYPEILVIVDYDGYRLHGGDNSQVKRYFISFWNGVDLRYRLLKGPKVRISIAGIIISRGRDATPYLERNRVGRDAIDSAAALTDMGKYLFRERRLPVYDIAVAITKYDMCRRRKGGRCTKGTAGFAYVGGACVVNKRLEKVNSVAIIEDTGGFSGIIVAAHEVGHLLGAVHDGSPPPTYLGGPGAQRCLWEDGYIMSDLRHTEQGFRWSQCTIQSFRHFLNGETAICLHNVPHEVNALGRSLPGTLLSLDAQCHRDRGTNACFKDERVCAQLFCFDSGSGYCVAYRPAAEGSSCGNGMHCIDGRCTSLQSNIIPNYSNQFRTVFNSSNQDINENANYRSQDNEEDSDECKNSDCATLKR